MPLQSSARTARPTGQHREANWRPVGQLVGAFTSAGHPPVHASPRHADTLGSVGHRQRRDGDALVSHVLADPEGNELSLLKARLDPL
jgi:hypothetical protein